MPFNLHSRVNRQLYKPDKYPLIHFIDQQNDLTRYQKQRKSLKYFSNSLIILFLWFVFIVFFFDYHIRLYNAVFGPFHLTSSEFVEEVKNFRHKSWTYRKEYLQIEIGEDNLINPKNPSEIIRYYSNPRQRDRSIAHYRRIRRPWVFIKLPTKNVEYFHHRFPFDLNSFSISTLQCIVKRISMEKFWDKSDFVRFINNFYDKNSTEFNVLVLSHCGVFIGFIYQPLFERAFQPHREFKFDKNDLAFDSTGPYASKFALLIQTSFLILPLLFTLFFFIRFLTIVVRRQLHRRGIYSFNLDCGADIREELWLLNWNSSLLEQIILLDRSIQQAEFRWKNRLFLIRTEVEHLYVVMLRADLDNLSGLINEEKSPFIICNVCEIKNIVHHQGVAYGEDKSWIPWPFQIESEGETAAQWLHNTLMDLNCIYRERYENRLQSEVTSNWNFPQRVNRRIETDVRSQFIREEENFQRLQSERQSFWDIFSNASSPPASAQFIGRFRYENSTRKRMCDEEMANEEILCSICFENIRLNDQYAQWPCPSTVRHLFHFDCMWKYLRRKNTCPLCRHSVEAPTILPHDAFLRHIFGRRL